VSHSWREALTIYFRPQVASLFFLGFAAGLPLLLVFSTLTAWLSDAGVSRSAIGFFGWVGITYSIKVLWAPVIDRLPLPWLTARLGKRRSWMLAGQLGIVAGLLAKTVWDPQTQLAALAVCAVLVAFASSTQDVAIDAYRIEAATAEYQGAMSAAYIFGYRSAMLVAGAGALFIAEGSSWQMAYAAMAALMVVGVITVLLIPEPAPDATSVAPGVGPAAAGWWPRLLFWCRDAVVAPFTDFFRRNGRFALIVLVFIAFYRLGDITMGIMANPFYLELGFSKTDIATIGKLYGFGMTILGSFVGGVLVVRYGVFKPLIAGAVMVASTNVLFAQLALVGPDLNWLTLVISADNLSAGLANAAFIAYLSGLTSRAYTATQYALFSSLMTLPGKFMSGFSGVIVDHTNYQIFFLYAAAMGIPAIVLSVVVWRRELLNRAPAAA
jgi:PAT family beta-lactamase induction signal transducer AmpG